jgi:hypothetical protein
MCERDPMHVICAWPGQCSDFWHGSKFEMSTTFIGGRALKSLVITCTGACESFVKCKIGS